MKAPDKSYVSIGYEVQTKPFHHSIEYIRKDALLEFLTNLEKDSARNAGTDDSAYAAHEMVCLLIDKIKLL